MPLNPHKPHPTDYFLISCFSHAPISPSLSLTRNIFPLPFTLQGRLIDQDSISFPTYPYKPHLACFFPRFVPPHLPLFLPLHTLIIFILLHTFIIFIYFFCSFFTYIISSFFVYYLHNFFLGLFFTFIIFPLFLFTYMTLVITPTYSPEMLTN